ncbi:Protein serine/threonine phosphatase PrpC, regulation of stationary phase [Chondromyces apiculatus DSM 436]|uniref:Protein serine/threonine phosphatase PrpC, regulation of stationary phase n=2 Tax=Chondromyces apiculatus TaxID=51 RepID=A0A017TF63_9BACT|nr:Protein serine/threonine phosphatase PrpC, regulation of stationary phase [Chondromyces apiculatus DSM 436]
MRTSGGTRPAAAAVTDVGRQRKHNEDHVLVRPELGLFVVADGMGGHNAGNVASALAATSLDNFFEATQTGELPGPAPDEVDLPPEARRVVAGIRKANHDVFVISSTHSQHQGMGSTVVAAHLALDHIHVAHVGDSRCYRIRNGTIEQLTKDHSLINDALALKPDLTPEELARLPKNIITRALGMKDAVKVDIRTEPVQPGDLFLLCSDGLSGMVNDEQILDVFEFTREPQEACELLIAMANEAGGTDNISALIVRIDSDEEPSVRPASSAETYQLDELGMLLPRTPGTPGDAQHEQDALSSDDGGDAEDIPSAPPTPGQEREDTRRTPWGSPPSSVVQQSDRPPPSAGRYVAVSARSASSPPPDDSSRRRKHVEVRVARCANCGYELFIGNNFCVECGAPLKL